MHDIEGENIGGDGSARSSIGVIGSVDGSSFPLQKKYQSLEFLRDHLHLRSRTNTSGAVLW